MPERFSWAVADAGGDITTVDARQALDSLWTPGPTPWTPRQGRTPGGSTEPWKVSATAPTPDGNVTVNGGHMIMRGTRSVGGYTMTMDAAKTINILSTPAHGSLTRWDLIIAHQSDTLHSDADNQMRVRQVTGTPSATPADPSLTSFPDCVVLARVIVGPAVTSITQGNITDLRPHRTVALGGVLPVLNATERTAIESPYEGMTIYREDYEQIEVWDGSAWRVRSEVTAADSADLAARVSSPYTGQRALRLDTMMLYRYDGSSWTSPLPLGGTTAATRHECRYRATTPDQQIPDFADTKVQYPVALYDCNDVSPNGSFDTFTINRSGLWLVEASFRFDATDPTSGNGERVFWIANGSAITTGRYGEQVAHQRGDTTASSTATVTVLRRFTAGDTVSAAIWHNTGFAMGLDNTWAESNNISFAYLRA
ncbi:hypothetical protein M8C13_04580 [Crossiella sp. SN42]|uniref:hypothetical protein n=1 Tax=Crossiella sp. SN42 TaxID=2944808 RepID=UPI00207CFF55|nr:hypothetical protein [Crossiella sp. SN42]MCO1575035.1 hypothetical protein [Crossiella sp. SN42]